MLSSLMYTYRQEVEFAVKLAMELGPIALAIQQGGAQALGKIEKPDDGGPVTLADLELNERIVDALRQTFSGDGIVAEESADTDERWIRERCWYIDPIDGTSDFSKGLTSWAIHIGLCVAHQPAFGLVYEPALLRASWGITHGSAQGAYALDGQESSPRRLPRPARGLEPLRVLSSRNHPCEFTAAALLRLGVAPENHRRIGSTGVKIAKVARGEAELYLHPLGKTKLWDSCAPQALLEAAGGQLSGCRGDAIRYDTASLTHPHGLLASSGIDHEAVAALLAPLSSTWYV